MTVQRTAFLSVTLFALFHLVGCSTTRIANTWKDPSFSGPIHFNKTVTICIHPDATVRRIVEDEMVAQIGAEKGAVAGHTILSDDDRKDVKKVKAKLQSAGFDGAVVLKLAGARSETGYGPGAGGDAPFHDYYDSATMFMSSSEQAYSDTIIGVQANIYSVSDEKLIWSATVELTNPTSARQIVDDMAKAVGTELKKEKLL